MDDGSTSSIMKKIYATETQQGNVENDADSGPDPAWLSCIPGDEVEHVPLETHSEEDRLDPARRFRMRPIVDAVDNPEIGIFLASVIEKTRAPPINLVSKELSSTRLYPLLYREKMDSKRLPPGFTLKVGETVEEHSDGNSTLIILHSLSYGNCHIAANLAGQSCVLKFLQLSYHDNKYARQEAQKWNIIWKDVIEATTWTTMVKDCEMVVVMPYVQTLENRVGEHEQEVREAILYMARMGYKHPDLCGKSGPKWHHVGVRHVRGKLKAVLIDLTALVEIDKNDDEQVGLAEKEMPSALGLSQA